MKESGLNSKPIPEKSFGELFWKKIREEMRIPIVLEKAPRKPLKLFELDPEDMQINLELVKKWSIDNE